MESFTPRRILIVASRTAGTPGLSDERSRAMHERCRFVLLVPRPYWDPETEEALTLELAIPLLEEAAGGHVEGLIGGTDALVAVRRSLGREPFDEVIVSTLPARVSDWLHRDLPSRVEQLGVSVTVVTGHDVKPPAADRALADDAPRFSRVMPHGASDPSLAGRRRSRGTRPLSSVPLAAGNPLAGERPPT